MYTITDLYDLDHTLAADYLKGFTYPWEALKGPERHQGTDPEAGSHPGR